MRMIEPLPTLRQAAASTLQADELDAVRGGAVSNLAGAPTDGSALTYKLDRCFVKSWSTSGDAG